VFNPENVATVVSILKGRGFEKVWTKYDNLPSEQDFRRYEKRVEDENQISVKVTIDFFVKSDIPYRDIKGWQIVEPVFFRLKILGLPLL